jgi:hypothetical protein
MLEIERRRVQLGFTFIDVDNLAGTQDGYLAKLMWPDTPSGKIGRWETLQMLVEALFPKGFEAVLREKEGSILDEASIRKMVYLARVPFCRKSQRELMSEYGKKGRAKQLQQQTPEQRRDIARTAAKARWAKPRIVSDEQS